jgi:hypothetical protein
MPVAPNSPEARTISAALLFLALLMCAFAGIVTIALMFAEEWYDPRPHRPIFSPSWEGADIPLWILWVTGPYLGLALLTFLVRRRGPAQWAVLISIILIALPGLILVSPLIYEPPRAGWFDLSWNGSLPFAFVPLGQWILFAVAGLVVGVVWFAAAVRPRE